jgi:HAD superfamily hydrolase (TIGR01509 family)
MGHPAAVFFDLDGTLIDSEDLWWQAECAVIGARGGSWTRADQAHCLGGPLERVTAYMAQGSGARATPAELGEALLDEMERLLRTGELTWRPGALELLTECRHVGIPTGLVSASHRRLLTAVADAVAHHPGMPDPAFDVTVAGDEVNRGKPHPEPYLEAALRLGVPIDRCIVIEDSPTGVASGQASGAFVLAVPHLVDIPEAPLRHVVPTLAGVQLQDISRWASLSR